MKRSKMSSSGSRGLFKSTAQRIHPKNGMSTNGSFMRAGIRL